MPQQMPSRARTRLAYQGPKKNPFMELFRTLITIALAYTVAVFLQLVVVHISKMPHGPLWSDSFAGPFLFVMTLGCCVVLSIPYFNKEWDQGLRTFSMFSSVFLLAASVFSASGQFDPNTPLTFLTQHVLTPLRHQLRF